MERITQLTLMNRRLTLILVGPAGLGLKRPTQAAGGRNKAQRDADGGGGAADGGVGGQDEKNQMSGGFEDQHWAEREERRGLGDHLSAFRKTTLCCVSTPLGGRVAAFLLLCFLADVSNMSRPIGRCNHEPFIHAYQWQDEWFGWCSNHK